MVQTTDRMRRHGVGDFAGWKWIEAVRCGVAENAWSGNVMTEGGRTCDGLYSYSYIYAAKMFRLKTKCVAECNKFDIM